MQLALLHSKCVCTYEARDQTTMIRLKHVVVRCSVLALRCCWSEHNTVQARSAWARGPAVVHNLGSSSKSARAAAEAVSYADCLLGWRVIQKGRLAKSRG